MPRSRPARNEGASLPPSSRSLPRLTAALVAGLTASIAAATPALAQEGTRGTGDQQVVLTGRVTVSEAESSGTVVIFNGPATIEGTVRGDVIAFNGRVDVSGHVTRNVVAFNGPVTLGSTAEVDGDLVTRDRPQIAPGAMVRGELQRVDSIDIGTRLRRGLPLLSRSPPVGATFMRPSVWVGAPVAASTTTPQRAMGDEPDGVEAQSGHVALYITRP